MRADAAAAQAAAQAAKKEAAAAAASADAAGQGGAEGGARSTAKRASGARKRPAAAAAAVAASPSASDQLPSPKPSAARTTPKPKAAPRASPKSSPKAAKQATLGHRSLRAPPESQGATNPHPPIHHRPPKIMLSADPDAHLRRTSLGHLACFPWEGCILHLLRCHRSDLVTPALALVFLCLPFGALQAQAACCGPIGSCAGFDRWCSLLLGQASQACGPSFFVRSGSRQVCWCYHRQARRGRAPSSAMATPAEPLPLAFPGVPTSATPVRRHGLYRVYTSLASSNWRVLEDGYKVPVVEMVGNL